MAYSFSWDETIPAGSSDIALGDDRIRQFKTTIREALDDEHTNLKSYPTGPLMHAWKVTKLSSGSPYTATISDHVLLITTGASDYTVNLPTASGITGKPYKIKKVDSGAGKVIIKPYGTETIDGSATFELSHQNNFVDLVSDGTNWKIVSSSAINLDWDNVWSDPVHDHSSDAEGGTLNLTGQTLRFLTTPVNKINWTAVQDWTDIDISSNTGSDTAKAALLAVDFTVTASVSGRCDMLASFRKNGSNETTMIPKIANYIYLVSRTDRVCGMIIVECDTSEIFEAKLELVDGYAPSSISFNVDLIGYFV